MLAFVLSASLLTPQAAAEPILLNREFIQGERNVYEVRSRLESDVKDIRTRTFIPRDVDLNYNFTVEVQSLKTDGIAQILYTRPTMTEIEGETGESAPKEWVMWTNWKMQMDLSPINEILATKDVRTDKEKKADEERQKREAKKREEASRPPEGDPSEPPPSIFAMMPNSASPSPAPQANMIGSFTSEIQRLALFVGSLDSALDLSPKLHVDPVKVGDTWKRTVGYSPQRLGSSGRSAVQRLDYTFEYKGVVDSSAGKVHRVEARLNLDTDAAPFVNQMMRTRPEESGLKSVKLQLKATIQFDLDLKTKRTVYAEARSEGMTAIEITQFPGNPIQEQRLKGRSVMRLVKTNKP